ncbi:MAG: hypothetical protein ABIX28_11770 [Vicinamibacterales bacterium]
MRRLALAALGLLLTALPVHAADPLAEARRLYNSGKYELAAAVAKDALAVESTADAARVVLGRIQLEQYRLNARPEDLEAARASLRSADARPLHYRERLELSIGQAEVLFLEDRFGAAAELFEASLDRSIVLGAAAHERALDWWATALDRHALSRPADERPAIYTRILERMRAELAVDGGLAPGSYWVVAAARGSGDLELAWQAAIAGWVRASQAADGGTALRADLDRLVTQTIIPDRAIRLKISDPLQAARGMANEWSAFKEGWAK